MLESGQPLSKPDMIQIAFAGMRKNMSQQPGNISMQHMNMPAAAIRRHSAQGQESHLKHAAVADCSMRWVSRTTSCLVTEITTAALPY